MATRQGPPATDDRCATRQLLRWGPAEGAERAVKGQMLTRWLLHVRPMWVWPEITYIVILVWVHEETWGTN